MLSSLTVHNVVTISTLHIDFCKGLSVLTGETGAGKSILLDALGLILGNRANPGLIRQGQDEALVTGVFTLSDTQPIVALLADQDISLDDNTLILRRKLHRDGRSKIFLNDMPVSLNLVRQVAEYLIDIHGQFDRLLEPSQHLTALDAFAGVTTQTLKTVYQNWKAALKQYTQAQQDLEQGEQRRLFLMDSLEKLRALDPQENEEESLLAKRRFLMNHEKIQKALDQADQALYTGQVESTLMDAYKTLSKVAQDAENLKNIQESLDQALQAVQEAVSELQNQKNALSVDEDWTVDQIESRLFHLREQARRHQCDTPELPQKMQELDEELQNFEGGTSYLEKLKKAEQEARTAYLTEAEKLRNQRLEAGEKLTACMEQELAPLKLDKVRFKVSMQQAPEDKWTAKGIDQVEFYISTNVGHQPGPLQAIASGGELSRIMLALKVILNTSQPYRRTLIFDEIDTGLGGAVADAMGRRLKLLSQESQVLSITHSPQIAAHADHHYVVQKLHTQDQTETGVSQLQDHSARQQEIARMISGASITKEAEAAASQLLKGSANG